MCTHTTPHTERDVSSANRADAHPHADADVHPHADHPAPLPLTLPRVIECAECEGAGWLEVPRYVIGSQMTYRKGRSFYVADCERCDGEGTISFCPYGHAFDHRYTTAADGFCEACYEIAGKWDGTRCAHGMVFSCVVCDAEAVDEVAAVYAAPTPVPALSVEAA